MGSHWGDVRGLGGAVGKFNGGVFDLEVNSEGWKWDHMFLPKLHSSGYSEVQVQPEPHV